jgi:hypothetical protein
MLFLHTAIAKPAEEPFLNWALNNEQSILGGSGSYKGQRVTVRSEVTRYYSACSVLIVCSRVRSSYVLVDSEEAGTAACKMNLLTLFLGLWSMEGLFFTPFYLGRNLFGGEKCTVEQMLQEAKDPNVAKKGALNRGSPYVIAGICVLAIIAGLVAAVLTAMKN